MKPEVTRNRSGLRYASSGEDVRLGDRVDLRTLVLRRSRLGTVVCLPEKTARELANEGEDPESWFIRLDSGPLTGWVYSPEDMQPPARLEFVGRACTDFEVQTNEQIEADERAIEESATWTERLAALALLFVFLLLVIAGIRIAFW